MTTFRIHRHISRNSWINRPSNESGVSGSDWD